DRFRRLAFMDVSGILTLGGTILGTSNIADPFKYPIGKGKDIRYKDMSAKVLANYRRHKLDCVICVGGDGTFRIAEEFRKRGLPNMICIPKTIDNDVRETDLSVGFHSSMGTAAEAIDKIHSTAQSHHRIMVVEVMGRYAGWLALYAGVASGGDVILIPEIPFDIQKVCKVVSRRSKTGKRFTIIVVAEGATQKGGAMVVKKIIDKSPDKVRLGGIGNVIAEQIEKITGLEVRVTVLGHLLRGGSPSSLDRILATQFGTTAVRLALKGRFGLVVTLKGHNVVPIPISKVGYGPRKVPHNHPILEMARSVGTSFGA
ncbi:ATP-dependent 6-phosphofructokinase, partial [Candidatus Peregrinibacteria bacterium]|nr:ATP-dependent 6-phosphofructokinase [Candidatus Peregrinibacteria bacterium]